MASKIKLSRMPAGTYFGTERPVYEARVVGRGTGGDPFVARVVGPDAGKPEVYALGDRWMVETDNERFFRTLADARAYLDRFFEAA